MVSDDKRMNGQSFPRFLTFSCLSRHPLAGPLEHAAREEDQHLHVHPACVPQLHDVSGVKAGNSWCIAARHEILGIREFLITRRKKIGTSFETAKKQFFTQ